MKEVRVITVYPTKKSALKLVHPVRGPLSEDGSLWPKDGFTARRLIDGSVTQDKAAGFKTAKAEAVKVDDKPKADK